MRIISGVLGGRRLIAPKGRKTRPTSDRVKEAVFSVLTPYLEGAVVLDAFGGTGALGIEALSRSAEKAVFIEKDRAALTALRSNISSCGLLENTLIYAGDTLKMIPSLQEKFDVVFLDPPYNKGLVEQVLNLLHQSDLLTDDGIVVIEIDSKNPISAGLDGFKIVKSSVYGDTSVMYCRKEGE